MTSQPSEEDFRKACEEAGVDANEFIALYQSAPGIVVNYPWMNAILALARRIEAEREAVPVAWMYERSWTDDTPPREVRTERWATDAGRFYGWTETPLYAHPPKEPTNLTSDKIARIAELEAWQRAVCVMQEDNYGNGMATHMKLADLCDAVCQAMKG